MTFYYPGKGHATLSVTGTGCALRCKHCSAKYLESMFDVSTPEKFRRILDELEKKEVKGILLSGGCDDSGCVPFHHLQDEIRRAVKDDHFRINVHTGIMPLPRAVELREMGIENVCIDVVGTREAQKEVYGIEYLDPGFFLFDLTIAGFTEIIPHITVGLVGGKLSHEFEALRLVRDHLGEPKKLVLLSLIPTKGTDYEDAPRVSCEDMVKVIGNARNMFPASKLILGCMRPHYDKEEIMAMVRAGLDGVVNPSPGLERTLKDRSSEAGFDVYTSELCCSF